MGRVLLLKKPKQKNKKSYQLRISIIELKFEFTIMIYLLMIVNKQMEGQNAHNIRIWTYYNITFELFPLKIFNISLKFLYKNPKIYDFDMFSKATCQVKCPSIQEFRITVQQVQSLTPSSLIYNQYIKKKNQPKKDDPIMLNNMNSPSTSNYVSADVVANPKFNFIYVLEKELAGISQEMIEALCFKIFPAHMPAPNVYNELYKKLSTYFSLQSNKGNSYQSLVGEVLRHANSINEALYVKLANFLKKDQVKSKLFQNMKKINNPTTNVLNGSMGINSLQSNSKTVFNIDNKKLNTGTFLLQNLGNKMGVDPLSNKYANLLDKQLNQSFKRDTSPQTITINGHDSSAIIADKYMKERMQVQNLIYKISREKQLTINGKIENKKCLICQSLIISNNNSVKIVEDRFIFKCKDCQELFHKKCMPRQNNCAFCQLRNINPVQKVQTPLFLGILKKGTKKHDLQFQLTKILTMLGNETDKPTKTQNKSMMPPIELRCIRLKDISDNVANFINLFPDACSIMVNNRLLKQFQPLHKQSSLKYRRDECIKISSNVTIGMNKIVITERILKKDIKPEERIQPQNHLVGVYIVQSLQVPKPANKLQQFLNKSGYAINNGPGSVGKFLQKLGIMVSQFGDSENLLKQSMLLEGNQNGNSMDEQQIVCDSIKVPLICSLTLQKMKFPGRTVFCKHFTCFDVYNFILLNAEAKLPKWQCPICKAAAYKFVIDCVMSSILNQIQKLAETKKLSNNQQIKQNQQAAQVQFNKDLNIKLRNSQGNILINKKTTINKKDEGQEYIQTDFVPYWINNVYDLPIEGKFKRHREQSEIENKKSNKMDSKPEDQSKYISNTSSKKIPNKEKQVINDKSRAKNNEGQGKNFSIMTNIEKAIQQRVPPFVTMPQQQEQTQKESSNIMPKSVVQQRKNNDQKQEVKDNREIQPRNFHIIIEKFQEKQKEIDSLFEGNEENKEGSNKSKDGIEKQIIQHGQRMPQKNNNRVSEIKENQVISKLNESTKAKQQIRKLQIDDESASISEHSKKNQMLAKENIQESENQRKEPNISLPASQSQSQKMSQEDSEIEKTLKQYEERLQRLKNVFKAGADMPKVINMRNINLYYSSSKQMEDNEFKIFKNIQPSPFKPQEQKQMYERDNNIGSQLFNASYQSIGAYESEKQQNNKEEFSKSQKNFSNQVEEFPSNQSKGDENGKQHLEQQNKIEKMRQIEENIESQSSNEVLKDEREDSKSQSVPSNKPNTENKSTKMAKNFLSVRKQSDNLFDSYIPSKNPRGHFNKNKNTMTTLSTAVSTRSRITKIKNKPKQKSKRTNFQVPESADVIQLSD